ncbi:response regulator [Lysinibacter cavernae]|uniref:DNA-binding NarL/FixJ family response regulator n=1 Tax=Lysinibacter cavernae TaxID=1640652 RepID=A0A7X5R2M4_9MICO|nr:response regulator transcription factor [Lysinibacter cavernae]NIH54372.1 DNA-binding NarL/FixJ family response regulator [Lysinibacter cavernae]
MIRVMLVDDHAVVRAGLRIILETQHDIRVVGEASTGEECLASVGRLAPDLVVVDLAMGEGMGGIETIQRLRGEWPGIQALVFTTYDTDADIVRAVDAGAIGYVLKDAAPAEIYAAVRAGARGERVLSPPVASRILEQLQRPQLTLTPREAQILELLASGVGNKELSRQLFISEATVKTHLAHVYEKLGVDGRGAAIAVATQRGIIRNQRAQ